VTTALILAWVAKVGGAAYVIEQFCKLVVATLSNKGGTK